jgi:hypothetical protein
VLAFGVGGWLARRGGDARGANSDVLAPGVPGWLPPRLLRVATRRVLSLERRAGGVAGGLFANALAAELRRRMEDMRFRKEPDCFRSGRGEPSLFVFGVGEAGGVGIGADAGFGGVLWVDMVRGKC